MHLPKGYGSIAEYYHLASRNSQSGKHIFTGHQVHFLPEVRNLVAQSPKNQESATNLQLPFDKSRETIPLERAIKNRKSNRTFTGQEIPLEDFSHLVYHSCAVKKVIDNNIFISYKRNYPNSGNLGSVELYPIVLNVENLPSGIYHFNTVKHHLSLIQEGDFRKWLTNNVFYQVEYETASLVLVLTVSFGRLMAKYGIRGYRLGYLDAGHVSQNIYLLGNSLGLGVSASAGFIDEELDNALNIDGINQASVLTMIVGTL